MTAPDRKPTTDAELRTCLSTLEQARLGALPAATHAAVLHAAKQLIQADRKANRAARRAARKDRDLRIKQTADHFHRGAPETSAAALERPATEQQPASSERLHSAARCYVCKSLYHEVDTLYHMLCKPCAAENRGHREARADLRGRRALLTGGRLKIGFETALMLLRDGATVTVTTRFPKDAARRFAARPDRSDWQDRLQIVPLDLRFLPEVLRFAEELAAGPPLDILIHNAAQTVRRPAAWYRELAAAERHPLSGEQATLLGAAESATNLPTVPSSLHGFLERCIASVDPEMFPAGRRTDSDQQLDLRAVNSWELQLDEVGPAELIEVHLINAFAPFVLTGRLRDNMRRSPFPDRYVINVSAMEGKFDRRSARTTHAHTNMAKAAMNMQTRTAAPDYACDGIHMCSVDTGWITDENPHPKKARMHASGFRPPLDEIDGAARIYHPIRSGLAGEPLSGCLLKDYRKTTW